MLVALSVCQQGHQLTIPNVQLLSTNLYLFLDICSESRNRCSDVCTVDRSKSRGYVCSCRDGGVLDRDGHTCISKIYLSLHSLGLVTVNNCLSNSTKTNGDMLLRQDKEGIPPVATTTIMLYLKVSIRAKITMQNFNGGSILFIFSCYIRPSFCSHIIKWPSSG